MDKVIEKILRESPEVPGYGGGKWAIYSVGCCWWTSHPEDLSTVGGKPDGLPCCPHCGSVLMQAPLEDFVRNAEQHPEHYGNHGIASFCFAHSRYSSTCHRDWNKYFRSVIGGGRYA